MEYISVKVKDGLEVYLQNRFQEIKDFKNKEQFEKVIKGIFYLANLKPQKNNMYSRELIGYDGHNLMYKLYNKVEQIAKKYYDGKPEIYSKFLRSLFEHANSPYRFESEFVNLLLQEIDFPIGLTKEELKQINIKYLATFCSLNDFSTFNVWPLYHNCKFIDWIDTGERFRSIIPEAKSIMKEYFYENLDQFLIYMIRRQSLDNNNYYIMDLNLLIEIYDTYQNLYTEIKNKLSEDETKHENYIEFLEKLNNVGFREFVDHKFEEKYLTKFKA